MADQGMTPPEPSRTLDFDAYLAEQNRVPVILRFKGEDYDLGTEMPATLALELLRLRQKGGDNANIPPEKLETLIRGILGEHYEAVVVEGRLGLTGMEHLLREVFALFNPPANRGERRAVKKGRSRSVSSRSGA